MKNLVVLTGPTGVGKTELALVVAQRLGIPIINADSRQIFADIPIGTAAPTKEQQQLVKHYFVGILQLEDYYSAARFEEDVMNLLRSLFKESDVALMTGGSMMYIDAVCKGIDEIPVIREDIRDCVKNDYQNKGLASLLEELKVRDPEYYNTVDKQNTKRVLHAIEICRQTNGTYTSLRKKSNKKRPFNIIKIGLNRPREELYERINQRVLTMMDEGFLQEAERLYSKRHLNALNTVGYKELFQYIDGEYSIDEAITRIQGRTREYCRKQLTWYRRDNEIQWFHPTATTAVLEYIKRNIK